MIVYNIGFFGFVSDLKDAHDANKDISDSWFSSILNGSDILTQSMYIILGFGRVSSHVMKTALKLTINRGFTGPVTGFHISAFIGGTTNTTVYRKKWSGFRDMNCISTNITNKVDQKLKKLYSI